MNLFFIKLHMFPNVMKYKYSLEFNIYIYIYTIHYMVYYMYLSEKIF